MVSKMAPKLSSNGPATNEFDLVVTSKLLQDLFTNESIFSLGYSFLQRNLTSVQALSLNSLFHLILYLLYLCICQLIKTNIF